MKVILMTVILTSIVAIQVEDAIPAAMRKKLGLNLPVVSLSNEEHGNTTFLELSGCWSEKLLGKYVQQQHGKTNECYSFAVAKTKCEAAKDCGAIATQSNVCGGKYRVTHGGPNLIHYGNWKPYNLHAYTFSRKSNCALSNANTGCHGIKTEAACLKGKDGRKGQYFTDSPCDWCCGAACTSNNGNKCEPHAWLIRQPSYTKSKNAAGYDTCSSGSAGELAGEYQVWYRGGKRTTNMKIGCDKSASQPGIFTDRLHFKNVRTKCNQARDSAASMFILKTHGAAKYECLRVVDGGKRIIGSHYTGPNAYWGSIEYKLISAKQCDPGCWSSKLVGKYVKEQHGKTNECYATLAEAKTKCEAAGNCGAIAKQSNVCGGKYRVSHGGPTLVTYSNWKPYSLWAYTFSRESNCGTCKPMCRTCHLTKRSKYVGKKSIEDCVDSCQESSACYGVEFEEPATGKQRCYHELQAFTERDTSAHTGWSVWGKNACGDDKAGHEEISDLLVEMKKSIKESKDSAIKTATTRCTENTAAKVVKAEKTFSDGSKYFDLQGCAAGSQCEKSTEKEQKIAVAANKELIVLRAKKKGWEGEVEELKKKGNKNKEKKEDLEQKKKDNTALHEARMKRFRKVIAALTKIQKNLKETGKITWESLMSEEEHNAVGSFKVGKMLLMLSQGVDGVGQKDLVNKLKPLIKTFLKRLEQSKIREVAAHNTWIKNFIDAKIDGLREDDGELVKKMAALGEKIIANDILIKAAKKKLKDALAASNTERDSCVKDHTNFVQGQGEFDSETTALDAMIKILREAKLDAQTAVIRDETKVTKHGVKESIEGRK